MIVNQVVQKILGGKASLPPHQSPVTLQEQYFFIIFIFTSFGGHLCNSREYIYISMYRPLSPLDILSWLSPIKGEDLVIWIIFMSWVRFPRTLTLRQRLRGQPWRSESLSCERSWSAEQKPEPVPGALWLRKSFIAVMNWDKGAGPPYPVTDHQPVISLKLVNITLDKTPLLSWDPIPEKGLRGKLAAANTSMTSVEWASQPWCENVSRHPLHGLDPLTSYRKLTPFEIQFSSVVQSCLPLCDPMHWSTPGFPVRHQLPELTQTHVRRVGEAIQPSHPLSSPSPPAFRVFSNESVLCIGWPTYWSFSFSISPSNEYSGLISFRMDWLDLFAVQGTLKTLLQHHSSKASILRCSAFLIVQLSHPYMTTGNTIALTRWTFVGKVMSLLFNMLSRLVISFLPRNKHPLISWLQSLCSDFGATEK